MKLKVKISLLLLSIGINFSCEEYLTEEPPTFISASNFWTTESDARTGVDGIYRTLNSAYWRYWPAIDAYTDDHTSKSGGGWLNDFGMHVLQPNNRMFEQFTLYRVWWEGIARANTAIKHVPNIDMDETERNMIVGEARALRAFYYYQLVRAFGDLPLMLDAVETEADYAKPRSSADDIYDEIIIPDLIYAEEWCSDALHDGHVTKWTAKLLLSEVYLTRAGWRMTSQGEKVQGDQSYWAMARDKAKEVIDDSPHVLNAEYEMAWDDAVPFTPETIFEVSNIQVSNYGGALSRESNGDAYGRGYWGTSLDGDMPLEDEGNDVTLRNTRFPGRPPSTGQFIPTPDLWDAFEDGDERIWSLMTRYDDSDGNTYLCQPTFRKFIDISYYLGEEGTNFFYTNSNIILYRYADALLIYAEAQNEADGAPNADAYSAVNALRNRAGLGDLITGLSQSDFREAVLHERRVELNAEFKRKLDLIRTDRLVQETTDINLDWTADQGSKTDYVNAYTQYYNARPSWPDHEWLWPIPQSEMDLNLEFGWEQNAGY